MRSGFCHTCKQRVVASVNASCEPECERCHGTFVELSGGEDDGSLSEFLAHPPQRVRPGQRPSELVSAAIQQIIARAQREGAADGGGARSFLARGDGVSGVSGVSGVAGVAGVSGVSGVELLGALQPLLSTGGPTTLGDYALGSLGTIIEQLVANDPARRPTPASKKAVAELCKTVEIDQSHVDDGLKCAINKEPLGIGERATTLPCGHVFHNEAIARWLADHHSCPVCRHELPTDDDDDDQEPTATTIQVPS